MEILRHVNGLPNLENKEDCEAFVRRAPLILNTSQSMCNKHIFTMLVVDEKQIRNVLIPKIQEYELKYQFQ